MKFDINNIFGIALLVVIFILMYCYYKGKKKNSLITDDEKERAYKCLLIFSLVTGESINFTGYTDREYKDIDEFVRYCSQIEETGREYIITQGKTTNLLKNAIVKIELECKKTEDK